MVFIKFSSRHKIVGIGIAALLAVVLIVSGFVKGEASEITNNTKASVTQSYVSETQLNSQDAKLKKQPVEQKAHITYYTEQDVIDIAKVLYRECRGVPSVTQKACVAWTILNRADSWGSTIYNVVRAPNQYAFSEKTPVWDDLKSLARDVLQRWNKEKNGETNVGRVLPKDYVYFNGRNGRNYFRNKYKKPYKEWDYSLVSPYAS